MEIKLDLSKEYAIALEGGGAKGAYEIGVWQAFEEVGVKYCAVSGSSVGALNGALMAMRDLDKAVHLWENLTFSQIIDVDDTQMKAFFDKEMRWNEWPSFFAGHGESHQKSRLRCRTIAESAGRSGG
ncbi:MAG: patatin-like phospholipase family protein [Anaerotignum sp.]